MGILTTNIGNQVGNDIREDIIMPAIVDFPTVVQNAVNEFGPLFANEPERKHFAEYLTGLMIAHKKNVSAINREFAATTDQSCLNRWITEANWDEEMFNLQRINGLQTCPDTRFSAQGVIPIDNVLVDHDGTLIEDAGYFWDHADQRYKIAHDYLIVNYVCNSGKHYPLEFLAVDLLPFLLKQTKSVTKSLLFISVCIIVLMIPVMMISGLADERRGRMQETVKNSLS